MDADTYYTPIIPELSRSNTCKLYEINHGPPTHFNNLLTPTEDRKAMDNKSAHILTPKNPKYFALLSSLPCAYNVIGPCRGYLWV